MLTKSMPALALTLFALPLTAQNAPPPAPPPFKPFTQAETDRYLTLGKQIQTWFLAGHADSILAASSPEMVERLGLDGIRGQMDVFAEKAGTVTKVLVEKMTRRMGAPQYWWEAEVTNYTEQPIVMRWLFDENGKLVGAGISPKSNARYDPEG